MRRVWISAAALFLALAGGVPGLASPVKVVSQGPAVQAGGEAFVLHSEHTGRDYLVEVLVPTLSASLPGQRFPAIIALDGGYGITGPMGRMLVDMAVMDPAYMISVGYPPGAPNGRNRDLVHAPERQQEGLTAGGGGAAFQAFLTDELGPFLEARYPVDAKRSILFGHSLGGLFAANVLASQPNAFGGYIIASPSLHWDDGAPMRLAKAAPSGDGRRVLIAVGGEEPQRMLEAADKVATALSGPGSTFKVQKRVFAGENHLSYYPAMVLADFPQVLPRMAPVPDQRGAIGLDPSTYGRYLGAYRLADGRTVTVSAQGTKLMGQLSGLPAVELTPQSPTRFFVRGVDAVVTFDDVGASPAPALVLKLNGAEARASRAD